MDHIELLKSSRVNNLIKLISYQNTNSSTKLKFMHKQVLIQAKKFSAVGVEIGDSDCLPFSRLPVEKIVNDYYMEPDLREIFAQSLNMCCIFYGLNRIFRRPDPQLINVPLPIYKKWVFVVKEAFFFSKYDFDFIAFLFSFAPENDEHEQKIHD